MTGVALTNQLPGIVEAEGEQQPHALSHKTDAARGLAAGARERLEQMRRQAFVQRTTAGRIDVHPIALHAVGAGAVALIDGDADTGLFQALREREAADAAADDHDVKRRGLGIGDRSAVGLNGHHLCSPLREGIAAAGRLFSRRFGW
jgi:hypothetical protein